MFESKGWGNAYCVGIQMVKFSNKSQFQLKEKLNYNLAMTYECKLLNDGKVYLQREVKLSPSSNM